MFPKLKNKALLAPMAGVTNVAFRALAREYGAGLTYTELVSSAAVVRGNKNTLKYIQVDPAEKPVAVQIVGGKVDELVASAEQLQKDFDIIDINCGCPVPKVAKTGGGCELLKNPVKIGRIIKALVEAIKKPITLKIRLGITNKSINALEVSEIAESAGASAVAIHGRTQKQGYKGGADWKIIKKIKEKLSIPVIGNGDVTSPEIFKKRLEESGVDFIMIGRAAMGNPYIFTQVSDFLEKGTYSKKDKFKQFKEYLNLAEKYSVSQPEIKAHAMHFTKGTECGAELRNKLSGTQTIKDITKLMGEAI